MARELPDDTAQPRRSTPDPAACHPLPVLFAACAAVCVAAAATTSHLAVIVPCALAALGYGFAALATRPRREHR